MKPSEIRVGVTYVNKGAGTTWRKVLAIGNECRPVCYGLGENEPPNEPGVSYVDNKGRTDNLYLSTFATWAGGVKD